MGDGSGRWMAIDWTARACGPPEADVARTVYLLVHGSAPSGDAPIIANDIRATAGEAYLAMYQQHAPLDVDEVHAWIGPLIAARLGEPVPEERDAIRSMLYAEFG